MFTGIIEATSQIVSIKADESLVRIVIQKPPHFHNVKLGDSIAINGVCLTVENVMSEGLQFALAFETLKALNLTSSVNEFEWKGRLLNVERSLVYGGRVEGHLVAGHVDTRIELLNLEKIGESWILKFELPESLTGYIWKKGSCALNGVSLTINEVEPDWFSACLIPETIKRTNFLTIKVGDKVNFEADMMARAIVHNLKLREHKGVV